MINILSFIIGYIITLIIAAIILVATKPDFLTITKENGTKVLSIPLTSGLSAIIGLVGAIIAGVVIK